MRGISLGTRLIKTVTKRTEDGTSDKEIHDHSKEIHSVSDEKTDSLTGTVKCEKVSSDKADHDNGHSSHTGTFPRLSIRVHRLPMLHLSGARKNCADDHSDVSEKETDHMV